MSIQDTTITFRISQEDKQKAKQVAALLNVPLSTYVKEALMTKVQHDAAYAFYKAQSELEELNNGLV